MVPLEDLPLLHSAFRPTPVQALGFLTPPSLKALCNEQDLRPWMTPFPDSSEKACLVLSIHICEMGRKLNLLCVTGGS